MSVGSCSEIIFECLSPLYKKNFCQPVTYDTILFKVNKNFYILQGSQDHQMQGREMFWSTQAQMELLASGVENITSKSLQNSDRLCCSAQHSKTIQHAKHPRRQLELLFLQLKISILSVCLSVCVSVHLSMDLVRARSLLALTVESSLGGLVVQRHGLTSA